MEYDITATSLRLTVQPRISARKASDPASGPRSSNQSRHPRAVAQGLDICVASTVPQNSEAEQRRLQQVERDTVQEVQDCLG